MLSLLSSLSIVVPAYNEEFNLTRTVLEAGAVLRDQTAERLEWILVDDGSTDGPWFEAVNLAALIPGVLSLKHTAQSGLGAAIWTGMEQASSEWRTWIPADGQIQPQASADMAELADGVDIVLLIREETKRRSWGRRILTLLYRNLDSTVTTLEEVVR